MASTNSTDEPQVGSLLKWEMTDDADLVMDTPKSVGGLEDFSFSMLDTTDLTFVHKFFIGMVLITFPMQWHFGCPAFISACWAMNTLVTLSFSRYINTNSEKFGLDIAKIKMKEIGAELQAVEKEKKDLEEYVEEMSTKFDKVLDMQQKTNKLRNEKRFDQIKRDQQKILDRMKQKDEEQDKDNM